ncbi:hypothetical protein B484DRAFT_392942, partial [Ochromonadaceae sp. CCMP2298]
MKGKRNDAFFQSTPKPSSLQTKFKNARAAGTLSLVSQNPPLRAIPLEVFDLQSATEEGEKFWEFEPLRSVDLSFNKIVEVSEDICGLVECTSLKLRDNEIAVLPAGLWEGCVSLQVLDLSANRIDSLSPRVCNLHLKQLLLAQNRLHSTPIELLQISTLLVLDLSGNQLCSLPGPWELTSLTSLNLSNNRFTSLPVISSAALEELHVSGNTLSQLPDMSPLLCLRYVDASQNQMGGFPRLPRPAG